jgi:hypothetical protein
MTAEHELAAALVEVVKDSLRDGIAVEFDGLGTFLPREPDGFEFIPENRPRVFVAYAHEDSRSALRLVDALNAAGIKTWIDKRRLLPGQDWHDTIERAICRADFFIGCFSRVAVRKRGQFPYELRFALRCADRMPLDEVFVMPVRLEPCLVPQSIQSRTQYVDLFPDWDAGVTRLVESIRREYAARRRGDTLLQS